MPPSSRHPDPGLPGSSGFEGPGFELPAPPATPVREDRKSSASGGGTPSSPGRRATAAGDTAMEHAGGPPDRKPEVAGENAPAASGLPRRTGTDAAAGLRGGAKVGGGTVGGRGAASASVSSATSIGSAGVSAGSGGASEPEANHAPEPAAAPTRNVYTVTRLNREVRILIERGLGVVWVEGELSNFSQPGSGHWYFSLKDRDAQVRCAMFRLKNSLVGFTPKSGQHVLVRGRLSLYEARGDYQLIIEHLEEAGVGALKREFERLKTKLSAEGLFALERKRSLPKFPRRIGVVTSPSGAAIRDILHILARRFPPADVLIYPTSVQGAAAVPAIVRALQVASARAECDVLIVARGGGSLEDLWAFNDERVARAICACSIPVVSGVGHEIDFTIADFVADARAPTPSGAAELVVPDRKACLEALARTLERMTACLRREMRAINARCEGLNLRLKLSHPGMRLLQQSQRLDDLEQRMAACVGRELRAISARCDGLNLRLKLSHPGMRLLQQVQRLDDLEQRLSGAMRANLHEDRNRVSEAFAHLVQHSPDHLVREYRLRHEALTARLEHSLRECVSRAEHRLKIAARTLDAVSPLATMTRGFAIVTRSDGTLLTDADSVNVGDEIEARLARGKLKARVVGKE